VGLSIWKPSARTSGAPARNRSRSTKWHASPKILPPPATGSCTQCSGGTAPALTVATMARGPGTEVTISRILAARGEKRRLNPTSNTGARPFSASAVYAPSMAWSSWRLMQRGFSTNTCLPAWRASRTKQAWVSWRVDMTTAWASGSCKRDSASLLARAKPNFRPRWAALIPPAEPMALRTAPASLKAGTSILPAWLPAPTKFTRGAWPVVPPEALGSPTLLAGGPKASGSAFG
jgi:hypothetical protein